MSDTLSVLQQSACVAVGGCLGALSRWGLATWVQTHLRSSFPAGTLCVNVLGCAVIGAALGWLESRPLPDALKLILLTGFLGSLTTFSTFGAETFQLLRDHQPRLALANLAANLALGLLAVALGFSLLHRPPA